MPNAYTAGAAAHMPLASADKRFVRHAPRESRTERHRAHVPARFGVWFIGFHRLCKFDRLSLFKKYVRFFATGRLSRTVGTARLYALACDSHNGHLAWRHFKDIAYGPGDLFFIGARRNVEHVGSYFRKVGALFGNAGREQNLGCVLLHM